MNSPLDTALEKFFHTHNSGSHPVLLAFSGGPDSQALFAALLEYAKRMPLSFAVAHVDHCWRQESSQEASQLAQQVRSAGIVYHEKVLDPKKLKGNLEQACREERYKFFCELMGAHGYRAVLTAHHRDDVAENVLKRIFEGNSLPFLSGMDDIATVHGATVWRPLLQISKGDILDYIAQRKIDTISDSTNADPRFLRARMRTLLLPSLAEAFGKEIAPGLCHISHEATEFRDYLEKSVEEDYQSHVVGPFGVFWDFSKHRLHPVEAKFLFRKICHAFGAEVSRDATDTAAELICSGKANKSLEFASHNVFIDRARVFCVRKDEFPTVTTSVELVPGQIVRWGPWLIEAASYQESLRGQSSWQDLWQGSGAFVVPEEEYRLGAPVLSAAYPGTNPLSKWWTDNKVPAFLRNMAPLLFKGEKVVCEFLAPRGEKHPAAKSMVINFSVSY